MASFTKLASGSWRVQVRHKGRYVSESFQRREDARRWATEMEGRIDRERVIHHPPSAGPRRSGPRPAGVGRAGRTRTHRAEAAGRGRQKQPARPPVGRRRVGPADRPFRRQPAPTGPHGRIIKFAVASAMRQEEICRVTWSDLNARTKMLTIRDRKARARRRATTSASPVGGLQLRRPGADRGAAGDPQQRGRADIPLQPQVRQARITKKTA